MLLHGPEHSGSSQQAQVRISHLYSSDKTLFFGGFLAVDGHLVLKTIKNNCQ